MKTSDILYELLDRVSDVGRSLSSFVERAEEAGPEGLAALCEELVSGEGEATGLALARQILERFEALETAEKVVFFAALAERFGVDEEVMGAALERWKTEPTDANARALHFAAEPRSQELIRLLNRCQGGTVALVGMRAALLEAMRGDAPEKDAFGGIDADFRHLFGSWFNRGFLELRTITWGTPAAILEKVIAYEAVHAISGWDDLRRRVATPDRRLYAFFHPALRDDPLIFVEVALTQEIPAAIGPVLADDREALDPGEATTAVFYSISNCQVGLRGVSFGSFLIKQVVEELSAEFPRLKTFVTLSPVPGLRAWALANAEAGDSETVAALEDGQMPARDSVAALAARYLTEAKGPRGGAADPVARFHLGNGARLEQIHAEADRSTRGKAASWGVMVNYLYDLRDIEKNHEAYANDGAVAASAAVRRLARARPATKGAARGPGAIGAAGRQDGDEA